MKGLVVLSVLVSLAMICGCQKQDPAAEAQLARRKAELDTREKALDEREKALGDWEKAMTKFRTVPSHLESRKPTVDPEEAKAERERRIQQLPPELQALIRDRSLLDPHTADKTSRSTDRTAELQRRLDETRKKKSTMAPANSNISDTQAASPFPSATPE